jgi:hypothetical protein
MITSISLEITSIGLMITSISLMITGTSLMITSTSLMITSISLEITSISLMLISASLIITRQGPFLTCGDLGKVAELTKRLAAGLRRFWKSSHLTKRRTCLIASEVFYKKINL